MFTDMAGHICIPPKPHEDLRKFLQGLRCQTHLSGDRTWPLKDLIRFYPANVLLRSLFVIPLGFDDKEPLGCADV